MNYMEYSQYLIDYAGKIGFVPDGADFFEKILAICNKIIDDGVEHGGTTLHPDALKNMAIVGKNYIIDNNYV